MPLNQDTLITIREFLPNTQEPPIFTYLLLGFILGVIIVIIKYKRYKKIRELFMKLF